jgi:hypothetical protein
MKKAARFVTKLVLYTAILNSMFMIALSAFHITERFVFTLFILSGIAIIHYSFQYIDILNEEGKEDAS